MALHAQLNVDADDLTNRYQTGYGKSQPMVYRFPKTRAQLHLSGWKSYLQVQVKYLFALSVQAMEEYLCACNRWTHSMFDTVDWDAHGTALSPESIPHPHSIKLAHDILATSYHVSQYSELCSSKCPCVHIQLRLTSTFYNVQHMMTLDGAEAHPHDATPRSFLTQASRICQ